jgi:hypothetical protein
MSARHFDKGQAAAREARSLRSGVRETRVRSCGVCRGAKAGEREDATWEERDEPEKRLQEEHSTISEIRCDATRN